MNDWQCVNVNIHPKMNYNGRPPFPPYQRHPPQLQMRHQNQLMPLLPFPPQMTCMPPPGYPYHQFAPPPLPQYNPRGPPPPFFRPFLPQPYLQQQHFNNSSTSNTDQRYAWIDTNAPNVLLYIDNSNIFESAKKHSGQKKGYRNGIPDVACRIDIGKLISRAVGGRGLLFGKLYGSEPPALDTVWEAIRRKQVHVETFQRSKWTLKEKETDASLVADAVEDILTEKDNAGNKRTVILFSGDRDLLRVVTKAVKHDYRVEIWSFKSAINNQVKRMAQDDPDKVVVNAIDDIFNEITYTKVVWGKTKIPPERSLVARVSLSATENKPHFLKQFVAKAGEIFQLPMMGKFTDKYKYIILVPCIKECYTPPTSQGKSQDHQAPTRTYDFYRHIQPFIHQVQEFFNTTCVDIQTWMEFNNRNTSNSEEVPLSNKFSMLRTDDDEDSNQDGSTIEIETTISDDESEDFDCIDFFDTHHEDPCALDDDGFIPNVRKEAKQKRLYSGSCVFKFACGKGLNCSYKHADKEKEFFKLLSDPKRRYLYKTKPCYHAIAQSCNYNSKPYLCPYAHNLEESRCLACKQKGNGQHWMDQCPVSPSVNNNNVL